MVLLSYKTVLYNIISYISLTNTSAANSLVAQCLENKRPCTLETIKSFLVGILQLFIPVLIASCRSVSNRRVTGWKYLDQSFNIQRGAQEQMKGASRWNYRTLTMFHSLFALQKRQFPYANVCRTWMFPPGIMGAFTFYYLSSTEALRLRHRTIYKQVCKMYSLVKFTLSCLANRNYKWHYVNWYILAVITFLLAARMVLKALLEWAVFITPDLNIYTWQIQRLIGTYADCHHLDLHTIN